MPTIAQFFGIVIRMYFDDHNPPHFHAYHGSDEALFSIDDCRMIDGTMSPRHEALVKRWWALHREELTEDWKLAQLHMPLKSIKPLE